MSGPTDSAERRISTSRAAALVVEHMPRWPAERVALTQALGGVLREALSAERDQPPFDRVTMDGIALSSADLAAGGRTFRLTGTQGAGEPALRLGQAGDCVEIMTGAALPNGADTIVPVEQLTHDGKQITISADFVPQPGQFIHRQASDHRQGEQLLAAGTVIGAPEMAILTIGGQAEVSITRWPRIALISTGNELVAPGRPLAPTQIRASNDQALAGSLRQRGFTRLSHALLPDEPGIMHEVIGQLLAENEVLILCGGVSMGKFDHVPATLAALGMRLVFHKILQRPGLPMWFGISADGKPVFALPGNPVSSLVCLVRYVIPGLLTGLGASPPAPLQVSLAAEVNFAPDLSYLLPVSLSSTSAAVLLAEPRPTNTSGDFVALHGSVGFVELPRGQDLYPAGFVAPFRPW